MAQKIKIAPERREVTRVWNISDWDVTSVPTQTVMVLGQVIQPGKSAEVHLGRLKNAHKVMKDQEAGLIFIGDKPPKGYRPVKKRLKMPAGAVRSRGPSESAKPVEAAPVVEKYPKRARRSAFQELLAEEPTE